jgi:conjugal transfer pilus assembly protein TraW
MPAGDVDLALLGPHEAAHHQPVLDPIGRRNGKQHEPAARRPIKPQARQRVRARIEQPPAVAGLRRAQVGRTHYIDPSVRFDEPIADDQGRVLIAPGTVANPLSVVRFNRTLLFFDGRDAAQVAWAKAAIDADGLRIKPVLTGGSPPQLMREWKLPVYFDQGGRLVSQFQIRALPARVTQEGLLMRIDEVPVQ